MITQEELHKEVLYDPETGQFTWKFSKTGRRMDKPCGSTNNCGYVVIGLFGKVYPAHRLACLYMLGYMPEAVDHLDKNRANNVWSNLHPTTLSYALLNNKTEGVTQVKKGKWIAYLKRKGKRYHLGTFTTKAEALIARRAKLIEVYPELIRVL